MDLSNGIQYQNGNNRCVTMASMGQVNVSALVMCSADNSTWSVTAHGEHNTPGGDDCTAAQTGYVPTTASGTCFLYDKSDKDDASGSTLQVSMTLLTLSFVSVVALGL